MKRIHNIEQILQYIEDNSNRVVTVEEVVALSGYSFYHFCHSFSSYTGVPVATYLRRRQMARGAQILLENGQTAEAAAASGFRTSSGFAKAFRKNYGLSPQEYRREMSEERFRISPFLCGLDGFTAVGYRLAPPKRGFDVLDAGAYWMDKDFSFVSREDYLRLSGPNPIEIGAWIQPNRHAGERFYFFGPVVQNSDVIPDGLEALEVEAADYAVFPVPSGNGNMTLLNENVRRMWKYIFGEWLPQNNPYRAVDGKMDLEIYHRGKVSLYVPIVRV